jgi:lipopolysaccharide export system protein LptA
LGSGCSGGRSEIRRRVTRRSICAALLALLAPVLARPAAAAEEPLYLEWADTLHYDRAAGLVAGRGSVHVRYRDLDVRADEFDLDLNTDQAVFRGNVALEAEGQRFSGDSLTLDVAKEEWTFTAPRAALPPSFFEQGVRSPVYLTGKEVISQPGEMLVLGASITTCDRAQPHYHLQSHRALIYPGRRLVARNVGFFVGGRRLFTIPYFVVSLREMRRQPFVPEIGESEIEGKFLKTLFNYELGARAYGSLHLDFMQRRGIGYGIEQSYPAGDGGGRLFVYRVNDNVNDRAELTGRLEHRQSLAGFDLSLVSDYRRNDAFLGSSQTVRNTQLALDRNRPGSTTRLAFSDNSIVSLGQFTTQTIGLRHREYHDRSAWEVSTNYQAVSSALAPASDRELDTRFAYDDQRAAYDLSLVVQKQFDLDDDRYPGDNFYEVIDRLPEVTLLSDGRRLGGALARYLPGRYQLALGDYRERPTAMSAPRLDLRYDVEPIHRPLGGGVTVDATGLFRQDFYGDPDRTAQYAYGGNLRLGSDLGGGWQARLNYLLLERKGYSPFRFDYIGSYRSLTAGVERRTSDSRLSLVAGQDLLSSRWHDLLARADVRLSPGLRLTTTTGYDFNRGQPRDVLTRALIGSGRFRLGVGARYDPNHGEWPSINTDLDWRVAPKWRLQALSGYSGTAHEWLYNEIMLTRDLHCWEASLFYSQQRQLFRIDLRIKAFEWGGYDYGLGRFGQILDTSVGDLF